MVAGMTALQFHQALTDTDGMTTTALPTSAPMTLPRTRGERTAAKLRAAAIQAFNELGWTATRVEDVVQRAGVSHGTFYTYYDNKSSILEGLVARTQTDFMTLAESPWDGPDVHEALRTVITGFLALYQRDAVIMRTWIEASHEDPAFAGLLEQMRARFTERVGDHVSSAIASSGRTLPPATVAVSLVAMVEQVAYRWLVLGEDHDGEDLLEALVLVWGSTMNTLAGQQIFPEVRAA